MLVKIDSHEAFKNLMDKDSVDKVYFKRDGKYLKATDHKWHFAHNEEYSGSINFVTTEFYLETEEVNYEK